MNEELLRAIARLISGLHVPVSLGLPLGAARPAYDDVRRIIDDFGWSGPDEVYERIKREMEKQEVTR